MTGGIVSYENSTIEVLNGLEAIRYRPEMYVGRLDDPTLFNRLIQEALCLALDEAMSGFCTQICLSVSHDRSVTIRDNGRGLSMTPDAFGQVCAEDMFNKLYACRHNKQNSRLKQSCAMGVVVVNALSEWFRVRNFRDGACWFQEYHRGEALAPFLGEAETTETGLELSFIPDMSIFRDLHFDVQKLILWMRETDVGFGPPIVTKGNHTGGPTVLLFERCNPAP